MLPYIILAILNMLCAYFIDKRIEFGIKGCWPYMLIIVLLNTVILGLRDIGVGIDTLYYIEDYFNSSTFVHSVYDLLDLEGYDIGFLLLAKISYCFSDNPQSLMVMTELWIMAFLVLGAFEYRKIYNYSVPCFFLLFWLLYQHHSLNIMRQWCAVSLLFYGFAHLIRGNNKIYIVTQIVAYFFHSSSLLFILLPILYYISNLENERFKTFFSIVLIVFFVTIYMSFYALLVILGDLGVFKEAYMERYGVGSIYAVEEVSIGMMYVINLFCAAYLIYLTRKKHVFSSPIIYMLIMLFLVTNMLDTFRFIMVYFSRLSHYCGIVYIVFFSMMIRKHKNLIFKSVWYLYAICLLYSAYKAYMRIGSLDWSFYYTSKILGI